MYASASKFDRFRARVRLVNFWTAVQTEPATRSVSFMFLAGINYDRDCAAA